MTRWGQHSAHLKIKLGDGLRGNPNFSQQTDRLTEPIADRTADRPNDRADY